MNVSPGRLAAAGSVVTAIGIALIMAAARQQGIADAAAYYDGRKKPCGCPEHDAADVAAASADMNGGADAVGDPGDIPAPPGVGDPDDSQVVAGESAVSEGADPWAEAGEELEAILSEPVEASTGRRRGPKGAFLPNPKPEENGTGADDLPEREAGISGLPPRPLPADRAEKPEVLPTGGLPPRPRPTRPANAPSMGAAST